MDCFDSRFSCLFACPDKFFIVGKINPIGFFDLGLEENLGTLSAMKAERKTHDFNGAVNRVYSVFYATTSVKTRTDINRNDPIGTAITGRADWYGVEDSAVYEDHVLPGDRWYKPGHGTTGPIFGRCLIRLIPNNLSLS
jgi:hypothetical protein